MFLWSLFELISFTDHPPSENLPSVKSVFMAFMELSSRFFRLWLSLLILPRRSRREKNWLHFKRGIIIKSSTSHIFIGIQAEHFTALIKKRLLKCILKTVAWRDRFVYETEHLNIKSFSQVFWKFFCITYVATHGFCKMDIFSATAVTQKSVQHSTVWPWRLQRRVSLSEGIRCKPSLWPLRPLPRCLLRILHGKNWLRRLQLLCMCEP